MGTKLFSALVTVSWMVTMGCGGKTSEALPSDAQLVDMTAAEDAVEGGVAIAPPAAPAMASSDAHDPEAQPAAEGDGGAGAAADSPPEPEQAPSFCGGRPTTVVRVAANLDSDSTAINTAAIVGPPYVAANPWDPQNPGNTANFSTTVAIYDSLGAAHSMEIYLRKSDSEVRTWDYHLLLPAADVVGGVLDGYFEAGGGTLRFASDGALMSDSGTPATIAFRNASVRSTLKVDFAGRVGTAGTVDGTTSVAGSCTVLSQFQDGYAASWGSGLCAPRPRSRSALRTKLPESE
jgi:Flagellar basal body protein FlaE